MSNVLRVHQAGVVYFPPVAKECHTKDSILEFVDGMGARVGGDHGEEIWISGDVVSISEGFITALFPSANGPEPRRLSDSELRRLAIEKSGISIGYKIHIRYSGHVTPPEDAPDETLSPGIIERAEARARTFASRTLGQPEGTDDEMDQDKSAIARFVAAREASKSNSNER